MCTWRPREGFRGFQALSSPLSGWGRDGCAPLRLTPIMSASQPAGAKLTAATRRRAGSRATARAGRREPGRGPQQGKHAETPPPRPGPAPGPAPSRAALLRAPPAGGSESEAERLTSRRHRQTSPRVRRGKQPERRRRRRRRRQRRQRRQRQRPPWRREQRPEGNAGRRRRRRPGDSARGTKCNKWASCVNIS